MKKITVLPYERRRCVECGADLPKGRRKKCHFCRPKRVYRTEPEPPRENHLVEHAAMAYACGISYGQLMAILENGRDLPPVKRPQALQRVRKQK